MNQQPERGGAPSTIEESLASTIRYLQENWSITPEQAEKNRREEQAVARREALLASGMSKHITSEDFHRIVHDQVDTRAGAIVRRFVLADRRHRPWRFLVLLGPRGFGKTVAGALGIAMTHGRHMPAEELRRAYNQETQAAAALREKAERCLFLLVDDVGTEKNAASIEQMSSALYQVVERRQGRCMTVFTANMTAAQFERVAEGRTLDRIRHQGAIIEVKGENLRRDMMADARESA